MNVNRVTPGRHPRWLKAIAGAIVLFLVLGVVVSQQFPSLTRGPKSSVELLQAVFAAPFELPADAAKYAIGRVKKDAAIVFVQACDVPPDAKARITRMIQGEEFREVTVPFVYYLYELYGTPLDASADLEYGAAPDPEPPSGSARVAPIERAAAVRRHAGRALRLFDALFLRTRPGTTRDTPVAQRYDEAAYAEVKAVVRELAAELLATPSDAESAERSEYLVHLENTLRDDEKLSDFIEFFSDFVRELTDSWLESFVVREQRKEARLAWVEERLAGNRYYEIADYAAARSHRRLALHVVVDGLQGKLLEGLCQLSSGDRDSSGARYVIDLVRQHRSPEMDPARYDSKMPPGLGDHIIELAEHAPSRPDYLATFKKYFYAPDARAAVVHVASVDTPSISVRNLPIILTGHPVAGPHGTGIPNFSYLDRATGRGWYFWGSDVLYMRDIFANREGEIPGGQARDGPGARTLFDRLWRYNTVSCMGTVDDGALEKISAEVGLAVGELRRNFIEQIIVARLRARADMERQLNQRRQWLAQHRNTSHGLVASLITRPITLKTFHEYARFVAEHEDEGIPDYLLWYNPWPDHWAHYTGPFADAIIGFDGEFDRLDFYLGHVLDAYESVPAADGTGSYADHTLVGIVSDHGLVYTPQLVSADELLFEAMRRDGIEISYQKLTQDEGGMPAIHSRHRLKPTRPFDAVVGSTAGGSYIIDLFGSAVNDRDPDDWPRHPGYHELKQYHLLSGQTIDWIEQLKTRLRSVMDIAVVRETRELGDSDWIQSSKAHEFHTSSMVRVVSADRGEARIHRLCRVQPPECVYRYEIVGDQDPLDLVGSVREYLVPPGQSVESVRERLRKCIGSTQGVGDQEWRDLLSSTMRPDVIYQLSHLYDSDRAGTVNVFPLPHVGMNSSVPGRHAGEAFAEKNGVQIYRGAGVSKRSIQTARNGSMPVTLYHWLVGDAEFKGTDSRTGRAPVREFGYPSLLAEFGASEME